MKLLNKFMKLVLICQKGVEVFEESTTNIKKVLAIVSIMVLAIIICVCAKSNFFASIIAMLFLCFIMYINILGWHSSVIQLLKMVFFYNAIFLGCILGVILTYINQKGNYDFDFTTIFVLLYFVLWFFTSMIARCKVARLVNEVISAILTILFTAGTYISSIISNTYPSLDVLEKMYRNEQELENALSNNTGLVWDIMPSIINYALTKVFLFILPFLCVSIFCLASISVKEYWLKKNNEKEYWDKINPDGSLKKDINDTHEIGNEY